MKKLSKAQEKQRDTLIEVLNKAAEDVRIAVEKINTAIDDNLNPSIEAYNSVLEDISTFKDEIVADMEVYADERSDKWRESDAGSSYNSWQAEWENVDLSELSTVDHIDEPEMEHAETLGGLPLEAEG